MKYLTRFLLIFLPALVAAGGAYILFNRVPDIPVEDLKARWAPPPSRFISHAGMQVHIRDEGPRDDPAPIVLIHGTSASLHTWEGWVEELSPDRRVITLDTPGFGLTGPAPDNNYTIGAYARFIIGVLDALDVQQPVVLGGNSLGGHIALETALQFPERVGKLLLVDSSGLPFQAESTPIGFIVARIPVLNKLMEIVLPRGMVEDSVKNVYADPRRVTPDLVDRYFELTAREGNRRALTERFKQQAPGELADRLGEIKIPTLIIWGAQDKLIPLSVGERLHKGITGSRLVVFEDLGHVPQEEDPRSTVRAFQEFLGDNNPEADSADQE